MEVFLITFLHGNYALAAFNRLQGCGIKNVQLIQTPFSIRNECDLCIKTNDPNTLDIILRECRGVSNVYSQVY
ncbi:MAG TPA: DUF3343 domain-containing protein, partial [Tissierellia bacterium]|nr:DUF3343 domain-containing protein [Tissierellia bacterium]